MAEIKAVCDACGGTGIYCGMCEPKGTGVVCFRCDGTGCRKIKYTPFKKRTRRRGVQEVKRSRGTFIATGVGPTGGSVTYREFLDGKMP